MQTPGKFACRHLALIFTTALTLLFVGCVAIESNRHIGGYPGSGLAYYLPTGRVKLTVVHIVTPTNAIVGTPGRTEKVSSTNITTSGFQPAPQIVQTNPDGTIIVPVANRTLTNFVGEIRIITVDSTEKAAIEAQAAKPPRTNLLVSVDVELGPDRTNLFLLHMKPSALGDDFMKFRVTNGLLESVILTNSDQSLAALNNLALAAIEFTKFAAQAAAASAAPEPGISTTNTFLFDPFDTNDCTSLSKQLRRLAPGLEINFDDFRKFPTPLVASTSPAYAKGIFYRPLQSYTISWSSPLGDGAALVSLPNASPTLSLEVSRAAFVSQSWMVGMSQGVPYEVALNKPSEVGAVSAFPLNLARSLVSLPTNLIQLKFDIATGKNELVKAQNAYITNLQTLLQQQQDFDRWLATNGVVPRAQPTQQSRGGQ